MLILLLLQTLVRGDNLGIICISCFNNGILGLFWLCIVSTEGYLAEILPIVVGLGLCELLYEVAELRVAFNRILVVLWAFFFWRLRI